MNEFLIDTVAGDGAPHALFAGVAAADAQAEAVQHFHLRLQERRPAAGDRHRAEPRRADRER